MWAVLTTDEFDQWFAALSSDARVEVAAKITMLSEFGPRLSRPHADTLNGSKHANMKELRVSTKDQELRIAFAFEPQRSAVVLVGGDKSGVSQRQFYKRLITKADKLYDAHLESIKTDRNGKPR